MLNICIWLDWPNVWQEYQFNILGWDLHSYLFSKKAQLNNTKVFFKLTYIVQYRNMQLYCIQSIHVRGICWENFQTYIHNLLRRRPYTHLMLPPLPRFRQNRLRNWGKSGHIGCVSQHSDLMRGPARIGLEPLERLCCTEDLSSTQAGTVFVPDCTAHQIHIGSSMQHHMTGRCSRQLLAGDPIHPVRLAFTQVYGGLKVGSSNKGTPYT